MKKKLLSAVLSAAMLFASVPMVHAEEPEIDVLLNGEFVEFADQAPAMINDRTLVPIRAVVEKMGATVGWDEATQTATVTKGETNLALTINDPSITVNGEKKPLDVAPALINNRTMLPIRAVVEELGCTVGWDDDLQTVIIIDWNAYLEALKTNAPAFYEYMSSTKASVAENYVASMDAKFTIDFAAKVPSYDLKETEEIKCNLALSIESNESAANDVVKSENVIKADLASLQDLLKKLEAIGAEDNIDLAKLDEIKFDIIISGETIYFKTNLVKKLADVTGEKKIKSLAVIFNSSTWMKVSLSDFAEVVGMSEEDIAQMKLMLSQYEYDEDDTALDVLVNSFKTMEYDFATATAVDAVMDMYASILSDDWIKFEKTSDGGYKISMKLDKNGYIQLIKDFAADMGEELSAEDIAEIEKMLDFNISCDGVSDAAGNTTTTGDISFAFNFEENGSYINVKFDIEMKEDMKVGVAEDITLPEDAIDLMELIGQAGTVAE